MKDIVDLIERTKQLIKQREEELQKNKEDKDVLNKEYSDLQVQKNLINVDVAQAEYKKSKIENLLKIKKQELIGTIALSIISISAIGLLGMIYFDIFLKFSSLKAMLLTALVALGSSPLVILKESKGYRRVKKDLEAFNVESVFQELDNQQKNLNINLNKQNLNRKKYEDLTERNNEIKIEIDNLKNDLNLLNSIEKMTIEQSLKSNDILNKILKDIYNENVGFEVNTNFQKIKK